MELHHRNTIIHDRAGTLKVIIGDLSCVSSKPNSALNISAKKQKSNAFVTNEYPIGREWSHHDKPIIEIWDLLTAEQKQAIEKTITGYQNEIFSLECQIAESGWYYGND
ncbi:hypothetical protein [Xenorhabdus bovienii]|uniref:hypothetical protein n=1 Tax=Xenorhabdus bovienii TaxID=40576 RepID=UPI0004D4D7BC|nr:hypothetical protein [Xenorhabdus bovienii]CDG87885.1 hypothetical protein XBFFR1_1920001 [Xenorhabdus bovienii str. feltiae France]CDG91787.1 hypothetical protein XBFFL1_1830002 [Xenorhabdus bovienii str. feltiae Florida]